MSRSKGTVATYEVKIVVPKGSNCHDLQLYIRDAITSYKGGFAPNNPIFALHGDDFTVALRKKETSYG